MVPKPELLRFVYDDFKTKSRVGRKISQLTIDCHGNYWQLTLYPDYPTIALSNKGKHDVDVTVSIILRDAKGYVAHEQRHGLTQFKARKSHSFLFLLEWSKIINREDQILNGKDLILEIEMHRITKAKSAPNLFGQNILKLLDNGDTADVLFEVQDTRIFAHRVLLQANAPILAAFCERCGKNTPITIHDTSPTIFRHVLRYVYGGEVPSHDFVEKQGIELLGAADRYGIVGLKLAIESMIVNGGVVCVSNVVEFLLFADATTSPLLKDHSMAYFMTRAKDVLRSKAASKLKESGETSFEVMEAILKGDDTSYESNDDYRSLSVEQLRRKLFKKGILELDGSKRKLIARLREQKIIERGCSTV